jgi:histidinol-phosphatase
LEYRGEQILGVAVAPALGHTYQALRGEGSYRDDRPLRVSDVAQLSDALMDSSSPSVFVKRGHGDLYLDVVGQVQRARAMGNFYGFAMLAQGSGDLVLALGVNAWDVAAMWPIIEEAGGCVTAWDGTPTIHRPDVLATNGKLHDETLRLLRGETS